MAHRFVVIAGDIDDLGALARLAQYFLHDVVMRLVPIPAPHELPAVDDIAHQVKVVGLGAAEKIEQPLGLAAGGAKVGIGDPDGAKTQRRVGGRAHRGALAAATARLDSGERDTEGPPGTRGDECARQKQGAADGGACELLPFPPILLPGRPIAGRSLPPDVGTGRGLGANLVLGCSHCGHIPVRIESRAQ